MFKFFEKRYAPLKLADSPRLVVLDYRKTIHEFSLFLACAHIFQVGEHCECWRGKLRISDVETFPEVE